MQLEEDTFFIALWFLNNNPSFLPKATPISASDASPGPLTTQPIIATLKGLPVCPSLDFARDGSRDGEPVEPFARLPVKRDNGITG